MPSTAIKTKYGTASIDSHGYYRIKTWKEGNNNKLLVCKEYGYDYWELC